MAKRNPSRQGVEAAAARIRGEVTRTPLLPLTIAGKRLWAKAECLQHTGSFKFRGGWSVVSGLAPEVRGRGVIAFSSGNHAQGVALAALRHDVPSVIVMPSDAPRLKIENKDRSTADPACLHGSLVRSCKIYGLLK